MFTKEKIQSIRQEFSDAEGEKAEVFDVMYANFDKLLDIAAAAPDLLEACKGLTKAINKEIDGNPDFVDSPVYAWLEDAHEAISKAKGE